MPKQIIAVDVDDVLAHHVEAVLDWYNKTYETKLTIEEYHEHWSQLWGITHEEAEQRVKRFHDERQHRHFIPRNDAYKVLLYLKEQYDLVVVTARRRQVIDDSLEWLDRHYNGIFRDVHFVPVFEDDRTATKAAVCRQIGASYLIDDTPRHCNLAAAEGVKALVFGNYIWNENEETHDMVVKVKDWHEVRRFFDGQRESI